MVVKPCSAGAYSQPDFEPYKELGFRARRGEEEITKDCHFLEYDDSLTVEINSLKELLEFIKKYGRIVMYEDEIEIYNYWRE